MKKLIFLFLIPLFVLFSSCQKESLLDKIPADASLVVSVDPRKMMEADSQTEEFNQLLATLYGISLKDLNELKENIEKCGIDWSKKFYLFTSANGSEPTFLFPIANKGNFESYLDAQHQAGHVDDIQSSDLFRWRIVHGKGLLAYTDNVAAFVAAPLLPKESILARLRKLWTQGEKQSFTGSPNYAKFEALDAASVHFFLSGTVLPSSLLSGWASLLLPFSSSLSEIDIVGALTATSEKITCTAEYYSNNEELQEFMRRRTLDVNALSGNLFKYLPAETPFCLITKANLLTSAFEKRPELKTGLTLMSFSTDLPLFEMLQSLTGEQLISVLPSTEEKSLPLAFYAECRAEQMEKLVRNNSPLVIPGIGEVSIGLKQSIFYLSTTPPTEASASIKDAGYSALRDGELLAYMHIKPVELLTMLSKQDHYTGGDYIETITPLLSTGVQAVEAAFLTDRRIEINIYRTSRK